MAISSNPLPNRPRADACGLRDGLRRLPALDLPYNPLSTARREPGILVHVHPVLPRIAEASHLQLPRPGPGGQPNESSQLVSVAHCLLVRPNALGRIAKARTEKPVEVRNIGKASLQCYGQTNKLLGLSRTVGDGCAQITYTQGL